MTQVFSPDVFNAYDLVSSGPTGNFAINSDVLRLPEKASYIILNWLPTEGAIYLDGEVVSAGITEISVASIDSNLLVWETGQPNTTLLLDIGFYAFEADDTLISLLQVYYPPDIVRDITENVVNGGNFKTGEDGEGFDTDAGDFDTGETVINGYSYDGGNFTTGERVGVYPPPASILSLYGDGELDPEADNIITLLDENLEPINTVNLPNVQYFSNTVVEADFTLDVEFTVEYELVYVTKYFEGFDYGSVVPDYGYDIDYGTVDAENAEGYDFNSILAYEEPTPASGVA